MNLRTRWIPASAVLLLGAVHPLPLGAQGVPADSLPDGTIFGVSIGQYFARGDHLTTLALHVTELRRWRAGVDFTLATSPYLVSEGVFVAAADLGVAWNVSRPGMTFFPKAGVSALAGFGGGEVAGRPGFYGGAGVVVRTSEGNGLRIDAAGHRYLDIRATIFSVSVGITGLPRPLGP